MAQTKLTGEQATALAREQWNWQFDRDSATMNRNTAWQLYQQFNTQFAKQSDLLGELQTKFTDIMNSPTGFSEEALAAMRTGASEQISGEFDAAQRNFQNRAFILGGRQMPSGAILQQQQTLESQRAVAQSGAQRQITLANEQLRQENMWRASQGLLGVAAQTGSMAGQALGGAESYTGASDREMGLASSANQAAYQMAPRRTPSLFGRIASGILGGALTAFGGAFMGPVGAALGSKVAGGITGPTGGTPSDFGGEITGPGGSFGQPSTGESLGRPG